MLATQLGDSVPEAKNVKQWIKDKIAWTLKTLQKRYVTTDSPVTSEDYEANQLCSGLEAAFIHGLRSKHIRPDPRNRKGGSLPQPVFWNLLKTITHRDVTLELEGLSFINSDVGRCRAWVRLALNDGLLECYMTSLLREGTELGAYYQSGALLLDPEEREVLLSLLQGLASLTFQLSYKSAVLNEWTTTPLALAGLCAPLPPEDLQPPSTRRESWDTASQSSGSGGSGRGREGMTASNLSLDTVGSSQLSSSLGSERGSFSCQVENRSTMDEVSSSSSQDLDVLGPVQDSMTESTTHSSSDENVHRASNTQDTDHQCAPSTDSPVSDANPTALDMDPSIEELAQPDNSVVNPNPVILESSVTEEHRQTDDSPASDTFTNTLNSQIPPDPIPSSTLAQLATNCVELAESCPCAPVQRTLSILSRKTSSDSVCSYSKSTSWISEEDFYKPDLYGSGDFEDPDVLDILESMNGTASPVSESDCHLSPPSVIHRRQIGLSNPFRGLLKLGQLERRGPVGLWRVLHCELSPFELRLYADGEERDICENYSLLRCEDVCLRTEGRFRLDFPRKKLHLRAPSKPEAEDWVERIAEAVSNVRCQQQQDEWDDLSPLTPPVPVQPEPAVLPHIDWSRPCEPEPDAIKEATVLFSREDQGWSLLVLSLSLEALRGFSVQVGHKIRHFSYGIEAVRDVVPAVALGGPAFFKVLTAQETLTLRAESGEEARSWRTLIRGALDLYLDEENGTGETMSPSGGNIQRLVQHRLKEDGALLPYLTAVPTERGLNAQNFKCAGCSKQIGVSFGRARLCEFSGQYYCDTCHHGDIAIIPSRMIHNWDLSAREISRQALKLLTDIQQEPLINLDLLNPNLFDHTETMAAVHRSRQRLRLLGDYLRICRSGIRRTMESRLQQRTYLLESSHLYSVLDLMQIADGQYEPFLQSLIQSSSKHIHNCELCTQRGFICQICNVDDIIFPFQLDTTSRCKACKTVFHSSCKAATVSCPRCERMQKYKERNLSK